MELEEVAEILGEEGVEYVFSNSGGVPHLITYVEAEDGAPVVVHVFPSPKSLLLVAYMGTGSELDLLELLRFSGKFPSLKPAAFGDAVFAVTTCEKPENAVAYMYLLSTIRKSVLKRRN